MAFRDFCVLLQRTIIISVTMSDEQKPMLTDGLLSPEERYINPYTDFGFKKLFGSPLNKDLLIGFLNALFEEAKQIPGDKILDVKYLSNEELGRTQFDRKAVFDVLCETEKGVKFHLEMQNVFQAFFIDRTIFYAARSIQNMAKRDSAKEGRWDFQLQKLYSINLLNFTFKENEKKDDDGKSAKEIVNEISDDDLMHCVMLQNVKTKKVFYDKLVFIYLEMPKFQKPIEECHTFYEKWLFVLQNLTRLMERPKELQERIFKKLFEQAEIAQYTAEEYDAYEDSLINLWDMANSNEAAEKKGIEKGRAEGELQAKLALARSMKADNMPVEAIAKYTGLLIDEINKL